MTTSDTDSDEPTPSTDMKRPRGSSNDDKTKTTSKDSSTEQTSTSSSSNPTTPKRPRHKPPPPPQLIIFDWTSEEGDGDGDDTHQPDGSSSNAPTSGNDQHNTEDKNKPSSNAAFHDILHILYDDTITSDLLTGAGSNTMPSNDAADASTQTGDQDDHPPHPSNQGTSSIVWLSTGDGSDEDMGDDACAFTHVSGPPKSPPSPKTFCEIERSIETLDDLIAVGQLRDEPDYHTKTYSVNVDGLHKMIPALQEFKELIGLDVIKRQVVDQIVYLSGKENHQQFAQLAAEAEAKRAKEEKRKADMQRGKQSRSSSLLAQLFDGLGNSRKPAGSQYSMADSVTKDDVMCDMFHTVIYGPPGVGKTVFAKLLARLFLNLGVTQNDTFRVARRSDLVGEYVGHTATKTQKVIDEAMGGVLFIDEVYALGNGGSTSGVGDGRVDSFSNECINTLNQNLTERKGEFICIVAGYKKETEKYFFDLNPGLKRRFSFYYNIDAYTWEELTRILLYKIDKLDGWSNEVGLGQQLLEDAFLKDKLKYFPHFAGDVETWLLNIKIAHCKRVFGKAATIQRVITLADVKAGYDRYLEQRFHNDDQRKQEEEMIRNLYS